MTQLTSFWNRPRPRQNLPILGSNLELELGLGLELELELELENSRTGINDQLNSCLSNQHDLLVLVLFLSRVVSVLIWLSLMLSFY